MPRTARVAIPHMPHHIVQRGHNRKAVFIEDSDYVYYLDTLRKWKHELDIKVYAWCLMTNHVHLILAPGKETENIGRLMKRLAGRQTRRVNKMEGRTGSIWDGRYKMSIIDRDAYLLQCCRYVELNPVSAGMLQKAEKYPWSSYAAKIGMSESDILDIDPCYGRFRKPRIQYQQFVEQGIPRSERTFLARQLNRNQLTGSDRFIDEVERRTGIRVDARGPGRPKK